MITDPISLTAVRENWAGVEKLKAHDRVVTMIPGYCFVDAGSLAPEGFWNLPFVLAYSVLDQVLTALKDEGVFVCGSWMLGAKMEASKLHLPWQDYDLIARGRDARNDLAHEAVLLNKGDCFLYIDAIGIELKVWGIL